MHVHVHVHIIHNSGNPCMLYIMCMHVYCTCTCVFICTGFSLFIFDRSGHHLVLLIMKYANELKQLNRAG